MHIKQNYIFELRTQNNTSLLCRVFLACDIRRTEKKLLVQLNMSFFLYLKRYVHYISFDFCLVANIVLVWLLPKNSNHFKIVWKQFSNTAVLPTDIGELLGLFSVLCLS